MNLLCQSFRDKGADLTAWTFERVLATRWEEGNRAPSAWTQLVAEQCCKASYQKENTQVIQPTHVRVNAGKSKRKRKFDGAGWDLSMLSKCISNPVALEGVMYLKYNCKHEIRYYLAESNEDSRIAARHEFLIVTYPLATGGKIHKKSKAHALNCTCAPRRSWNASAW